MKQHPLLLLSLVLAAVFLGPLLPVAAGQAAPFWEVSPETIGPGLPETWRMSGGEHLPPDKIEAEIEGKKVPVLRIANEVGETSSLDIPFPGLGAARGSSFPRLVIEIGAGPGGGRGLHWFLQRGDFDLRGDDDGVYLTGAEKKRVRIGAGAPAGRLSRVELTYDAERRHIVAASVDGVPAEDFAPLECRGLHGPGRLRIFAPTPSGRSIWVRRFSASAGADAAAARAPGDQPRWMRPSPADPAGTPAGPPPAWPPVANADALRFEIDPARLARPAFSGEVLLARADFARLPEALAADPALAAFWRGSESIARRLLGDGDWRHWLEPGKESRYTYVVRGIIVRLALLHAATGQEDLGRLVRLLSLDLARRPTTFWIHSELRPYDPDFTQGRLETAELARGLALSFQWTQDLFNDAERAEILAALRDKGLDPSLRWLEEPSPRNNFMAVIGGGALVTAKVLGDEPAARLATGVMSQWLDLVEDDGSYGEPVGYLEYGASAFFYGWWALGREQGRALLAERGALRGTLRWMAAHYVLGKKEAGAAEPMRINFGDDDVLKGVSPMVAESLAYAFDDGIGTWLVERAGGGGFNAYEFLFRLGSRDHPAPPATPPTGATAGVYAAGPAILRSGWTLDRDIVLALRGGGSARTGYSHDRGNRNAFMLFVDGELFFAAPGRASYRSPLANGWDRRITSHCGVSLDGKSQLRDRVARYTHFSDDGDLVRIASEAAGAYADSPRSMERRIWMDRRSGVIAIEDTILPSAPSQIGWHLLLADHDGRSEVAPPEKKTPGAGWRFRRPGGEVTFWIHADRPLAVTSAPGILHTGYSYYPGDPGEGKPGSARHLTWTPSGGATDSLRVWTLILTRSQEAPDARATFSAAKDGSPSWLLTRGGESRRLVFTRGG